MNSSAIFSMIEKALDRRVEQSVQAEDSLSRRPAERQAAFARITAHRTQLSAIQTGKLELSRQIDILAQQIAKLNVNLSRLQNQYMQRECEQMNISSAIEREESILRASCSPLLDQFLDRINAECEHLRKAEPQMRIGFGDKNLFSPNPHRPLLVYGQQSAIDRRLRALYAARDRAHELELLDLTDEQLQMEIEGIWNNLPTIDNLELVRV